MLYNIKLWQTPGHIVYCVYYESFELYHEKVYFSGG